MDRKNLPEYIGQMKRQVALRGRIGQRQVEKKEMIALRQQTNDKKRLKATAPEIVKPPQLQWVDGEVARDVSIKTHRLRQWHEEYNKWQTTHTRGVSRGTKTGAGSSTADPAMLEDEGEDEPPSFEKEVAMQKWIPGMNEQYVERLFARDMWKHVAASSSRVSFCKRGGSFGDDDFKQLYHNTSDVLLSSLHGFTMGGDDERNQMMAIQDAVAEEEAMARAKVVQPNRAQGTNGGIMTPAPPKEDTFHLTSAQTARGRSGVVTVHGDDVPQTARNRRGSFLGGAQSRRVPEPWMASVSIHTVLSGKGGGGADDTQASKTVCPRPPHDEDMSEVARIIASTRDEFRSMVLYRKQDTAERLERSHEELEKQREHGGSGVTQHMLFKRHIRDDVKALYKGSLKEIDRWSSDRDRLFKKKFIAMELDLDPTWDKAVRRMRSTVCSAIESEYTRERKVLQGVFQEKFCAKATSKFAPITPEGRRLLNLLRDGLSRGHQFGGSEVSRIIQQLPSDAFFLDDVVSILFSLVSVLRVPEDQWLTLLKSRTDYLLKKKVMTELPDAVTSVTWLLKIPTYQIGPMTLQWMATPKVAASIPRSELSSWFKAIPPRVLLDALSSAPPQNFVTEAIDAALALQHVPEAQRPETSRWLIAAQNLRHPSSDGLPEIPQSQSGGSPLNAQVSARAVSSDAWIPDKTLRTQVS